MVQNGKFALCAFALDKQLNRVDLPTLGSPTMPHFRAMVKRFGSAKIAPRAPPLYFPFFCPHSVHFCATRLLSPAYITPSMSVFPHPSPTSAPRSAATSFAWSWRQLWPPWRLSWLYRFPRQVVFRRDADYPQNWSMDGRGEDLFFLSNGHISPCLVQCPLTPRLL